MYVPEKTLIIFQGCYTSNGMTFSLEILNDHSFNLHSHWYYDLPLGGILARIIHLFIVIIYVCHVFSLLIVCYQGLRSGNIQGNVVGIEQNKTKWNLCVPALMNFFVFCYFIYKKLLKYVIYENKVDLTS